MKLIYTPLTENVRFKAKYGKYFITGFLLSAVLHFILIVYSPEFSLAKIRKNEESFEVVDIPPEIVIPPPPAQVAKPAVPVEAEEEPEEEITIADTTPEANIPIAPPVEEGPTFTPYDTPPRPIMKTIKIVYPELLKKAAIEGKVILWLYLDETGKVEKVQINISSGNEMLDEAAIQAMNNARFTPALQRDTSVPVWIQWPVSFKLK